MSSQKKILKNNNSLSYIIIHIQNIETRVRIWYDDREGLIFYIEFKFKGDHFKKALEKITSKEKTFHSDDISFNGVELLQLDKDRIAQRLNEILNYTFN